MELVAFIGKDQENWGQISALIKKGEWEKVIIVKNKGVVGFSDSTEIIEVDSEKPISVLKDELIEKIKPRVTGDFEVSLSLASGNGKEHMALISALLCIPVGIRLVVYTKEGIKTMN